MVLSITQATFDDAVKENINDFGLSPDEAITEAINQFKAQGVDLSNIITKPGAGPELENLDKIIYELKESQEKNLTPDFNLLLALKQECDKGIQYRVHAGRSGAYPVIIDLLLKSDEKEAKLNCLKAMIALMTKQPDLLDDRGAQLIVANLEKSIDAEIQKLTLKWCKESCVMHEMNRQNLMKMHIVNNLSVLLQDANTVVLKDVLTVLRALILDDDVRVEFGHAHEHARIIASETLSHIVELIKKFKSDEILINDLILTLSSLLVRAEFCLKVEEEQGIELIKEVMVLFLENEKITRQCFKVIKALAGNDQCKARVIQKGLAPVICNSLNSHKGVIPTASAGLHCVSALSLRSPDNSKALFEASVPEVIIEIMKKHPDEKCIQKPASWAIRNMVSRSRQLNPHFIELGAEDLLLRNLARFKEFEYDTKAALRDLECKVDLKEEWTGKGGKITSEMSEMSLKQD